ncbi:hypothetical protein HDU79_007595 [Rhizoclosmatium sp. JEL0117]|nr:hypothetical protein HDU79_007595 [Rhizoclosmatium sp. JEL0117]
MLRRTLPSLYPRYPRFSTPTIVPHSAPTTENLSKASALKEAKAPLPLPLSQQQKQKQKQSIPVPKSKVTHSLASTQAAVPLPTTFAHPSLTPASFKALFNLSPTGKPAVEATPLPPAENKYPFRFYQITLRRGLYGIEKDVKKCVDALGLHGRHQVVWRAVNPHNAGLILKVRELVTVELVNEVPDVSRRPRAVKGYTKVGTALAGASLSA